MKTLATPAIALIATGLAIAPAANAATEFGFKYSYDAQQLETEAGAQEVLDDLTQKIRDHCKSDFTNSRLANYVLDRQCTARTLKSTVTKINSPMLSKVYEDGMADSAA